MDGYGGLFLVFFIYLNLLYKKNKRKEDMLHMLPLHALARIHSRLVCNRDSKILAGPSARYNARQQQIVLCRFDGLGIQFQVNIIYWHGIFVFGRLDKACNRLVSM